MTGPSAFLAKGSGGTTKSIEFFSCGDTRAGETVGANWGKLETAHVKRPATSSVPCSAPCKRVRKRSSFGRAGEFISPEVPFVQDRPPCQRKALFRSRSRRGRRHLETGRVYGARSRIV